MGIHKFLIALDQQTANYYAGETFYGRILLWLDKKPKKFKGLKLNISGKAYVSWTRTENIATGTNKNRTTTSKIVRYSAREQFYKKEYFLEGNENGNITIAAGYEHVYPFSVELPKMIPSTFEGRHGYVRYRITVRLVKSWLPDIKQKLMFTVTTPLDLNYHPSAKFPISVREEKTFLKIFGSSNEPLILSVSLPQTGYVFGQDMLVNVNVLNSSNVNIDSIELKLIKIEIWSVHSPRNDTKKYKTELLRKSFDGVEAHSNKFFTDVLNLVPTTYTILYGCSIIQMSIYIKIKACVRSIYHKSLSAKLPIIVGTVPINNCSYAATNPQILYSNDSNLYSRGLPPVGYTSSAELQPPPPYSTAISMPQPTFPLVNNAMNIPLEYYNNVAANNYNNRFQEDFKSSNNEKHHPSAPFNDD